MSSKSKGSLTVILTVILASGWWIFDGSTMRSRALRSRLTLVVETPEGKRSGSSVTQTTISFPGGLTRAQGYAIQEKLVGESVVVDLGPRGLLFTTFETNSSLARGGMAKYTASQAAFPRENFRGEHWKNMSSTDEYAAYLDELNRLKPKAELSPELVPVIVRFRNPDDPTSVELLDPGNLAATFGSGVRLEGAYVEITDDAIIHGVEAKLPWLASSKVSPPLFTSVPSHGLLPPVEHLRYDDFRRLPN